MRAAPCNLAASRKMMYAAYNASSAGLFTTAGRFIRLLGSDVHGKRVGGAPARLEQQKSLGTPTTRLDFQPGQRARNRRPVSRGCQRSSAAPARWSTRWRERTQLQPAQRQSRGSDAWPPSFTRNLHALSLPGTRLPGEARLAAGSRCRGAGKAVSAPWPSARSSSRPPRSPPA